MGFGPLFWVSDHFFGFWTPQTRFFSKSLFPGYVFGFGPPPFFGFWTPFFGVWTPFLGFGVKFGPGRSISGGNRESWLNPLGTHPENPKKVRENPKIMRKTSIPVDFGSGGSISGGNRESKTNAHAPDRENPKKVRENLNSCRFRGENEGKMTPNLGGKSPLKDPREKGGGKTPKKGGENEGKMTPPETPIFTELHNFLRLGMRKCTFRVTRKTPKCTPILLVQKPLFFRVPPSFLGGLGLGFGRYFTPPRKPLKMRGK